jgi:hypothetical protein
VHDLARVRGLQGPADLLQDAHRARGREASVRLLAEQRAQIAPAQKLEHHVHVLALARQIVDLHHVGMADGIHRPGLVEEAAHGHHLVAQRLVQQLDGHRPTAALVQGPVDGAHAAHRQPLDQAIRSQALAAGARLAQRHAVEGAQLQRELIAIPADLTASVQKRARARLQC